MKSKVRKSGSVKKRGFGSKQGVRSRVHRLHLRAKTGDLVLSADSGVCQSCGRVRKMVLGGRGRVAVKGGLLRTMRSRMRRGESRRSRSK